MGLKGMRFLFICFFVWGEVIVWGSGSSSAGFQSGRFRVVTQGLEVRVYGFGVEGLAVIILSFLFLCAGSRVQSVRVRVLRSKVRG